MAAGTASRQVPNNKVISVEKSTYFIGFWKKNKKTEVGNLNN